MFTLVIGGAASGKSEYAEGLVLASPRFPRYYIATMEPFDDEGRARVEKHRTMRAGKRFETVERYTGLAGLRLPRRGAVLLECIGNLAANELYSPGGAGNGADTLSAIVGGVDALWSRRISPVRTGCCTRREGWSWRLGWASGRWPPGGGGDGSAMGQALTHGGDWAGYESEYGVKPLDFSANISPLGLPKGVRTAVIESLSCAESYPDPLCRSLRKALAEAEEVTPNQCLCGCGAADLIYRAVLAKRPRRALITAPAFAEYEAALGLVQCGTSRYFLKSEADFALQEDFLDAITPEIDLVFLCQPNNPTGWTIPRPLLAAVLERCRRAGALLVLDECFCDFLDGPGAYTMKKFLLECPNLLILKAFTKLYAMAGLRLGYCLCGDTSLLDAVSRAGQPWAVSGPAQAAGLEPDVRMNPILLKPSSDTGSQVIVMGEIRGQMSAAEYFRCKKRLFPEVLSAFDSLAAENDMIVIEGAGSPAEINLRSDDIVNMGLALRVDAPVLLAGDIDRGGVFAQLYGTAALLQPEERERIAGLIVNKFLGGLEILRPGLSMLEERTGKPVLGVVPYLKVDVDDEDSLAPCLGRESSHKPLDAVVVRLPRISNFTDFTPLEEHPQIGVRYVDDVRKLGNPDIVILPGTKSTISDLLWLRQNGLEAAQAMPHAAYQQTQLDLLADGVRQALDMEQVYQIMEGS